MFDKQPKQIIRWQDFEGGIHDTQQEAWEANHDLEFEEAVEKMGISHETDTMDGVAFESAADLREWLLSKQTLIELYFEKRGSSTR